jgi:hypothetical protein
VRIAKFESTLDAMTIEQRKNEGKGFFAVYFNVCPKFKDRHARRLSLANTHHTGNVVVDCMY